MREIPDSAIELIKDYEKCELRAYHDVGGYPTIGWGHLLSHDAWAPLEQFDDWTQEQADETLEADLRWAADAVERLVTVPLSDNQFGALVSFVFNIGPDEDEDTVPEGLGDSTLLRKLNAGDYEGAAREFGKWVNVGAKKRVAGLVRRRADEEELFRRA